MFSRLTERLTVETSEWAKRRRVQLAAGVVLAGVGLLGTLGHTLVALGGSWSSYEMALPFETASTLGAAQPLGTAQPLGIVLGPGIGAVFALVVVGSAVWLTQTEMRASLPSITAWSLGGAVVFGAVGQLFLLSQRAAGVTVPSGGYLLGYVATSGAVVGLLVGVYAATLGRARAETDAQRQRAETLSRRVSVLNRTIQSDVQQGVEDIRRDARRLTESADSESRSAVSDARSAPGEGDASAGVESVPTPQPDPAERIRRHADRLAATTETAGDLHSELDSTPNQTGPCDLVRLVVEVLADLSETYPTAEIETALPERAPASVDPGVGLAVRELVENALEHGDTEQPTVRVSCELTPEIVRVRIADDGPGVPNAALEPVLSENVAAEDTDGIGLWIANWVTGTNGGSLAFDTGDDGTTVTVRLPRADTSRATSAEVDAPANRTDVESGSESDTDSESESSSLFPE
jgi:signal transduction histidine kinase